MFIIVGLGNPGPSYAKTRHNIGFMVVEKLSALYGAGSEKRAGSFLWQEGSISGHAVIFAKPQTFMNLSGVAVRDILDFSGVSKESLLIVCDDCDLPLGRIRIKKSGGSAGHRGMASIIERIKSPLFARLRMGIGRGGEDLEEYVLLPFSAGEKKILEEEIEEGVASIEAIITRGMDYAMNRYNRNNIISERSR